ncbi:nuclear transport factor 2 family protein [Cytobacillus suaedae]|nr:nuclear transport factor 2 family protein [Cytobacillus suaedae]
MEHKSLEEEILHLEKRLMTYDYKELKEHLSDDFLEFGSSGNIFDKEDQLEAIRNDKTVTDSIKYTVSDFTIKLIASDVVLATYRSLRHTDSRLVLRSSVWKRNQEKWQMYFTRELSLNNSFYINKSGGTNMFVKVYTYHIQHDKVDEYLAIQEKVSKIYNRYLDFQNIYLQCKEDNTKWIEITKYKDEEEYQKCIDLINKDKEIQTLFNAFQSLLVSQKKISEEDFIERKIH